MKKLLYILLLLTACTSQPNHTEQVAPESTEIDTLQMKSAPVDQIRRNLPDQITPELLCTNLPVHRIEAADPEGEHLTYRIADMPGLCPLWIDKQTGIIYCPLRQIRTLQRYNGKKITVEVSDGTFTTEKSFHLEVEIIEEGEI